jgi:hypothetical protein
MTLALDRLLPRALIAIALTALTAGSVAWAWGRLSLPIGFGRRAQFQ